VTILDWPWACRGPAWLDTLLLLINARLYGGHHTHALLTSRAAVTGADPHDLIAVLTGLAGYFTDTARQPPPKSPPPSARSSAHTLTPSCPGYARYLLSPTDSHRDTDRGRPQDRVRPGGQCSDPHI
jgi:hypothetical protein